MLRAPFRLSETREVHRFTIQNLPHELLERIFEAVAHLPRTLPVDENYPYRRLFSKLPYCPPDSIAILSQVCIRWRETVLQMPALWSFIHLTRSLESHRRLRANLVVPWIGYQHILLAQEIRPFILPLIRLDCPLTPHFCS